MNSTVQLVLSSDCLDALALAPPARGAGPPYVAVLRALQRVRADILRWAAFDGEGLGF
jgi:hypothetical protein